MNEARRNSYLDEVFEQARTTTERITGSFAGLDDAQLNWKPSPDRWSIGQCLDHLITADELYVPQLEAIAAGRKQSTVWERLPLWPRAAGAMVRWATHPDSRLRSKTFTVFEPATSDIPATIVTDFVRHAKRLLELIAATDGVDHDRVVLTSPLGAFVTYSLKDAVIIMITHHERHYRQARAVLTHEHFPQISPAGSAAPGASEHPS